MQRLFAPSSSLVPVPVLALSLAVFLTLALFMHVTANAKDFAIQGKVFPIIEEDAESLFQRLAATKNLAEAGKIFQANAKKRMQEPNPVPGIVHATKSRKYTKDPSYIFPENVTDNKGKILAVKGTKINPLDIKPLTSKLVFIDGTDEKQVGFVKTLIAKNEKLKIILVKGKPLELEAKLSHKIYFDQCTKSETKGNEIIVVSVPCMTTQLAITAVPSLVKQQGKLLEIEEIVLEEGIRK